MIDELKKLRELTETLTGNGYLRDQAEEWEYALDAIPDYVYVVDLSYRIKFVNRLFAERLGKQKQELYNKFCYKITDKEENETTHQVWLDSENNIPVKAEGVFLKNMNGWFDMTRSPIKTKSNKIIGFICVLQDVTEKLKALQDLVAREATLETIFNSAPIGMGLLTKDRVLISVNKFLTNLIGYSEKELIGNTARILYPSEEEYIRVGKIKHAEIRKHGTGAIETKFITKSGETLDIYLRTSSIPGSDSMVFTVTDITNRKRRERQLKLNEDRLESVLELSTKDDLPEEEIIEYALEEAVRLTRSSIGYIHFVNNPDDDLAKVNLSLFKWSKAVHENCTAAKTPHYPLSEAGCWADCVRQKTPVIHNDYQNLTVEEGKKGLPEGHFPLIRHMSVPVMEGGRVVAVAGVGNKVKDYNKSDLRQLSLFMNNMWDIISRKQAREEAVKSKEAFNRLIKSSPMGVHVYKVIDDTLILTHFNDAAEKILNMDASIVVGKAMHEVFPGHKAIGGLTDIYKGIALGERKVFRKNMYDYEDDKIKGIFSVFAFQSDQNEVAVFFADVTEQAKIQRKLIESEQKYRLIAENLEDVIWTFDTDMNFTFVSPGLLEHMGYRPEEWIGHNVSSFSTPEDLEVMASEVLDALADPEFKSITFESKMLHKDGRNIPIEINARPIYVEGELVGFQGRTRVLKND